MKQNRVFIMKWVESLMIAALLFMPFAGKAWAAEVDPAIEKLMPLIGGALVEAGDKHWDGAAKELELFESQWKQLQLPKSALYDNVSSAMAEAKQALKDASAKPDAVYPAVSKLAKATGSFVSDLEKAADKGDGKKAAKTLLPILQQCLNEINQNDWTKAQNTFKQFTNQWAKAENAIRADNDQIYGQIETETTMARVSVQAEPPRSVAATAGINDLIQTINGYVSGSLTVQSPSSGKQTVADGLDMLKKAENSVSSGNASEAAAQMQSFITLWPSVEGVVRTKAPDLYTKVENEMTEALSRLLSNPPRLEESSGLIKSMQLELTPFAEQTSYSAWDAALVLLREGVEALLVLAALVAFLHRTGNSAKQKWIWCGAAAGLVMSGGLAILLNYMIANLAAGSTREMLEGITGLVSVALMLTVSIWLHKKSQVNAWNRYIEKQVGIALASGNLWSLFVVACLSILREGAETTIFYIGMAPSIQPGQLIAGIAGAILVLVVVGYIIVKGSIRLPIRTFFKGATVLIYYLVVKFLGESIHSLQVAGKLSSHVPGFIPSWGWLGVYPTWETSTPQLLVLIFIMIQVLWFGRKGKDNGNPLGSNPA
ncbi:FTR1 family iron permease [Paenibacillus sp. UNC451MF]|uniref:FTR1 family iron permease n=1 Tax=Paenibacillus sp. UNC451MF TaxID=1449063 RepID=UPI00055ED917|nr:FTR1 family protein [Paenibacillus sp. UNC451MF]